MAVGLDHAEETALPPHFGFEERLFAQGFRLVAGIDEAGRGPLAGPVSAAAVVLDPADIPEGLDDSKLLTPVEREERYSAIMAKAVAVGIGFASVAEIDAINIRQATFAAMRRAVRSLAFRPTHLLIDGKDPPPAMPCPLEAIIKGDGLSLSIAAASIVAKVTRDRVMIRLHAHHPGYGFDAHKGYATPVHRQAIIAHGLCVMHRRSFCSKVTMKSDQAGPSTATATSMVVR